MTVTNSGTAQAGAASTITLAAGASAIDSTYNGQVVALTGGTGVGQAARVLSYVGATRVAALTAPWPATTPDATSTYEVNSDAHVDVGLWDNTVVPTPFAAGFPRVDLDRIKSDIATADVMVRFFGIGINYKDNVDASTATTVTLSNFTGIPAASSANDGALVGRVFHVFGGTGAGQTRVITDYDGATRVATMDRAFDVTLDATSDGIVYGWGPSNVSAWDGQEATPPQPGNHIRLS